MAAIRGDQVPAETLAYESEPHVQVLMFEETLGLSYAALAAGIVLVIGIGLWLWNRSRKSAL